MRHAPHSISIVSGLNKLYAALEGGLTARRGDGEEPAPLMPYELAHPQLDRESWVWGFVSKDYRGTIKVLCADINGADDVIHIGLERIRQG